MSTKPATTVEAWRTHAHETMTHLHQVSHRLQLVDALAQRADALGRTAVSITELQAVLGRWNGTVSDAIERGTLDRLIRIFANRGGCDIPDAPSVWAWTSDTAPGGAVCGECGDPVESEPCKHHQPYALSDFRHDAQTSELKQKLTADVAAFAPDGDGIWHVLLVRRGREPYQDCWALPGGKLNRDESADTAAVRELLEETGVELFSADLRHVGRYDTPGRDPRGRYISDTYAVVLRDCAPATGGDDDAEAVWIPVVHLDDVPLAFDHRQILADAYDRLAVKETHA